MRKTNTSIFYSYCFTIN